MHFNAAVICGSCVVYFAFPSWSDQQKGHPPDEEPPIAILQLFAHRRLVVSPNLFSSFHFGFCSSELASAIPLLVTSIRSSRKPMPNRSSQVSVARFRTSFFHRLSRGLPNCSTLFHLMYSLWIATQLNFEHRQVLYPWLRCSEFCGRSVSGLDRNHFITRIDDIVCVGDQVHAQMHL